MTRRGQGGKGISDICDKVLGERSEDMVGFSARKEMTVYHLCEQLH